MDRPTPTEIKNPGSFSLWKGFKKHFATNKQVSANIEKSDRERRELLQNLKQAKRDLDIASANFEFVNDEGLVDYYIYQMKAAETRYQYLIRKAKEKNIHINGHKNIHIII